MNAFSSVLTAYGPFNCMSDHFFGGRYAEIGGWMEEKLKFNVVNGGR